MSTAKVKLAGVTRPKEYAAMQRELDNIRKKFSAPFVWSMDMLMLGVGIGFDAKGAGQVTITPPSSGTARRATRSRTTAGT